MVAVGDEEYYSPRQFFINGEAAEEKSMVSSPKKN